MGPPGVLGRHSLADALVDDSDHIPQTGSEDNVAFGDRLKRDGYRKGRIYKKGNWTAAEILVLQASRAVTLAHHASELFEISIILYVERQHSVVTN